MRTTHSEPISPSSTGSEEGKEFARSIHAEDSPLFVSESDISVVDAGLITVPASQDSSTPSSKRLRIDLSKTPILTSPWHYQTTENKIGDASMANSPAEEMLESDYLLKVERRFGKQEKSVQLDAFAFYCDKSSYPDEMRSLNTDPSKLFADGIVKVGHTKFFIRRIEVKGVRIGSFSHKSTKSICDNIYVQSKLGYKRRTLYRLVRPIPEYERFFKPYIWLAEFSVHFVEFLRHKQRIKQSASIHSFRSDFIEWLLGATDDIQNSAWLDQHPSRDFRTTVAANIDILHTQYQQQHRSTVDNLHKIWSEAYYFKRYRLEKSLNKGGFTIVTPYIYHCFVDLPHGKVLKAQRSSEETDALTRSLAEKYERSLSQSDFPQNRGIRKSNSRNLQEIKPGDTISTPRDSEEDGSTWKRAESRNFQDVDRWFAYVTDVLTDEHGEQCFEVIWYYRPIDTICGFMKYAWGSELFMSTHCSCEEKAKVYQEQIIGIHDVDFGGNPDTSKEFFCRQTYIHEQRTWITLTKDHLQCEHASIIQETEYGPGNTFLLHIDEYSSVSEPCELLSTVENVQGRKRYKFRRLLRRKECDPEAQGAAPNELVYSDQTIDVGRKRIVAPCQIRCFLPGEEIQAPYNRNGVGGFFFITHELKTDTSGVHTTTLTSLPSTLKQGYDPSTDSLPRLKGLDLFCGGGNFGRGLEEAGFVEMHWANDLDVKAIHTYMANQPKNSMLEPFLGYLEDLILNCMKGQFSKKVPAPGDVEFISGGSPCPGFSSLTNDKTSDAQRKNQSLVAAFASCVDLYRPKYGILENVPGMIETEAKQESDVFSQLICALVGLGYQLRFCYVDASSFGSPQRRTRIFVLFAAAGFRLPEPPMITHSHPPGTRTRGIGNLPTGERMAHRDMAHIAPFKFVSAMEACSDLPPIYDAKPDICVPFPDHRMVQGATSIVRSRISRIPIRPWGMNFAKAYYGVPAKRKATGEGIEHYEQEPVIPKSELSIYSSSVTADCTKVPIALSKVSNAYGRAHPKLLFDAIITSPHPGDAKSGRQLH